jgi:hypothetical protein
MKNKITDFRSTLSIHNWIYSRNKHFSRYILYSVSESETKGIQNPSIKLEDKEFPIFDCYSNDNNDQYTYLLITTHFLTSIIDNITYTVDIEDISFDFEIDDIIESRKNRTDYIEYICYELKTTKEIIPVWVECGVCENILWGIFNQLNFLKRKYGITNN